VAEAVRLVIWDLDETFWKGTLTEGGIREYVREHHDIVVELARRGIISSICSKNDQAAILPIMRDHGILDYFVFPSISWEPKGHRLAGLIETAQLRPATVMFIDDNPNNRAEAAAVVPDMQVEDETFITRMLDDLRFKGKDDSALTRLAQYKLLENRRRDEGAAGGDSAAFLRGCDVRVLIDYDVTSQIDRAVELINRTNQLNFTKARLPEDPAEARAALSAQINERAPQTGLVRVVDKYGDYGYVGFFLMETGRRKHVSGDAPRTLKHFCFSCRTLGMFVEQWLYEYFGRPELRVSGAVLTDLSVPRIIDWIRLVPTIDDSAIAHEPVAPEIRVYGGCEANAISVYLAAYTDKIDVRGSFSAGGLFVQVNSAAVALSMFGRSHDSFGAEAAALRLPLDLTAGNYLDAPTGTVFVFNLALDFLLGATRFRHRDTGWELALRPIGKPATFFTLPEAEIEETLAGKFYVSTGQRDQLLDCARHLKAHYDPVRWQSMDQCMEFTRRLIELIPPGSKLIFLLNHDYIRQSKTVLNHAPLATNYNARLSELAARYPHVGVVSFSDCITSDEQIHVGGNHYDRMVYLRSVELIMARLSGVAPRAEASATEHELAAD